MMHCEQHRDTKQRKEEEEGYKSYTHANYNNVADILEESLSRRGGGRGQMAGRE